MRKGILGIVICFLAVFGAMFIGFAGNVNSVMTPTVNYDYITDISGLFESTESAEFIEYSPASNWTGYYLTEDGQYTAGITYGTTELANQYVVQHEPETHAFSYTLERDQGSDSIRDKSTRTETGEQDEDGNVSYNVSYKSWMLCVIWGNTSKTYGDLLRYYEFYTTPPTGLTAAFPYAISLHDLYTIIGGNSARIYAGNNLIISSDWLTTTDTTKDYSFWTYYADSNPTVTYADVNFITGTCSLYSNGTLVATTDWDDAYYLYGQYVYVEGIDDIPEDRSDIFVESYQPSWLLRQSYSIAGYVYEIPANSYMDINPGVSLSNTPVYWINGYYNSKIDFLVVCPDKTESYNTSLEIPLLSISGSGSSTVFTDSGHTIGIDIVTANNDTVITIYQDGNRVTSYDLGSWLRFVLHIDALNGTISLTPITVYNSTQSYTLASSTYTLANLNYTGCFSVMILTSEE